MTEALFAAFQSAAREQWLDAVLHSLRGETFEGLIAKTYEGIDIHPLPQAEDLAGIEHHQSLPGQFPFVRGARAGGYRARPWLIASELRISDPRQFNRALRDGLANGQSAIAIDDRLGLHEAADIRSALADIDLARFPLLVEADAPAPEIFGLLCAALDEATLAQLSGCIGYDPLSGLARSGSVPDEIFERLAAHVESVGDRSPRLGSIAMSTAVYHDAGANAAQELALAIASGVAYLRELIGRGYAAESVAPKLHFFLNIGENFFIEIAKFRAIRLLWSQVLRAFGMPNAAQRMIVHSRSGGRNKSRRDAHVNLPRLTTEALSAAFGGVDSIQLAPFDQPIDAPDDFSRRISRNLQLILQDELRLVELIDPAGGAWHIEKLTDQLARAAWSRFQAIEADGGLVTSLRSGAIQAEISAVAALRRRDMAAGDAVLVGVNRYAESDAALHSTPPRQTDALDESAAYSASDQRLTPLRLAEPFEAPLSAPGSG